MKIRKILPLLLTTIISILGITNLNAITISDNGKYSLILSSNELDPTIDGEYAKIIKFDIENGETKVKISELTKGITPYNGQNEFSHWETLDNKKVSDELELTNFTKDGSFYTSTGEEVKYTNGCTLYAKFEGKSLEETGKYYVTLDTFGGIVNGKSKILFETQKEEFKTINLLKYVPVRKGYTFTGWDLDGKLTTSIDSTAFTKKSVINLTAAYTKDTFTGDGMVLILDANGGTIDGKESNKYDYINGGNSGSSMLLSPYVPVRDGYTFNGWNSKKDGSGKNYKDIYWRLWSTDAEFDGDRDTLIEDSYRYQNLTLYASWTKKEYTSDTVKEIKNDIASITFDTEVNKNYILDVKNVEIKKDLANKNIKYLVDINILNNNEIVTINGNKMIIKIALPDDLKEYKKYEVVYVKDDEIKETINAKVENGYIVFETSHLSLYGIVVTEKSNSVTNPQTGDNIVLYFITSFVSLAGIIFFSYKKRQA